jgi:RHH-type proline utilization regulon transcriptional repressor/proline dehydrogenase/delta 1-pyrroline-5-carboxylate dehydrogenase
MQYPINQQISLSYRMDEEGCLEALLTELQFSNEQLSRIQSTAEFFVKKLRQNRLESGGIDALLQTYDLSSEEGIALMCLAEALLRIPDDETRDRLIKDKISSEDWQRHLDKENTLLVNTATMGLLFTSKVLKKSQATMISRLGKPIIRQAVTKMMEILGQHFVMSETIEKALDQAKKQETSGYRFSYDMLGEAAKTDADALYYFNAYRLGIQAIAVTASGLGPIQGPGISVKLSALHPRYEWNQRDKVFNELLPRLKALALQAKFANIGFTLDAEEADRLELSLLLFEKLVLDPDLSEWQGLGLAVQAYQKRCLHVIEWVIALARAQKRRLMLRLVKGAYWDSEIKWTQERGLIDYPVFTRKSSTDISYLAAVKNILSVTDVIYPQFATHNAYTVAAILEMAGHYRDFEFQCLHGMGNFLYDEMVGERNTGIACRVYAPVGGHEHLLAYLVRRLLENGANSSFVNQMVDKNFSLEEMTTDPITQLKQYSKIRHSKIPLPKDLYAPERPNSLGVDFSNLIETSDLMEKIEVVLPDILSREVFDTSAEDLKKILEKSHAAAQQWSQTPIDIRIACLEEIRNLLQKNQAELMALLIREAGKTVQDAASELREAIDFCSFYSHRCREDFTVKELVGPTGERNQLSLHGRGVIVCISPWNFPLAIFLGQITAALAAGNTVIAKPATQTPLIAAKVISLLLKAGIPEDVLHFCVASGSRVSRELLSDQRVQGVMFTGSTATARSINQQLAAREGGIIPFIAETGGQNTLIVDSSALTEQVVSDVVVSAFNSAGQRCSALRILFLQEDVAEKTLTMLKGAMTTLTIGDPLLLSTDVGPVIDQLAKENLERHLKDLKNKAELLYECSLPKDLPLLPKGVFFAPRLYLLKDIDLLTEEVFGPILHVVLFKARELDQVLAKIEKTGYGLTLGIHSRINETIDYIKSRVRVGNTYVNRNMIGAVVGVQPFGGEGLSGTGPKVGGPYLLPRLAVERTLSVNLSAVGGNVSLMSLKEKE